MKPLSAFLASFLIGVSAAVADLAPLKYNHPGLVVDLGVGLWAWPMPMDYDGDGDLDLVVACPDKPSNGVYFFENPGGGEKMPVFKAGVRVGAAEHNFQVSYVDGKPRVLKPGFEFVDFRKTGFEKSKKIYPRTNVHAKKVRGNMWRYVDYDGDGDHDLIVGAGDWTDYGWDDAYNDEGVWRNGPLHGYVYVIENTGSDANPDYTGEKRVVAGGRDIDVYGWPSPNFADFDGDGDLDLLCGEFLDGFTYFQNTGSRKDPVYAAAKRVQAADGNPLVMDLQMITPTCIDWDRDGDLDIICGDEDGRVAFIEGSGAVKDDVPVFEKPRYFQQEADTLKFGALATPFAFDWDGDGDEDILCGNTAGYIGYFQNLGGGANPKWAAPELMTDPGGKAIRILAGPNGSIQGPCEAKWGYTTLSVADWDGDGKPDVIANSIWGRVMLYRGRGKPGGLVLEKGQPVAVQGAISKPKWNWWDPAEGALVTQWRTTPLAIDFTGNGLTDLVMLDGEGYLSVYARRKKGATLRLMPPARRFVDTGGAPVRLNSRSAGRSGRYKIAATDWDGDGRTDILVNSENATLYRNTGENQGKTILKKMGNLAERNVAGHTSSPAVCDFDKDGKPDLLVGAENGRIYFLARNDAVKFESTNGGQRAARPERSRGVVAAAVAATSKPGIVREEFVYAKAPFPQCHATTICETDRGLVVALFGGTREKNPDVGIWVSYDDGSGWTGLKEVANGIQYEGDEGIHRHPCWNPVLFQPPGDAPTMLFFKVGPNPREWWGELILSYDRGRTWRERRRLPEGIDGPVKNKPVLLDDGTLLCGSSTEYDGWRAHFELTRDFGKTWRRVGPINDGKAINSIQPSMLRLKDGRIMALGRTQESRIWKAYSKDSGKNWSAMTLTELPNPNAGTDAVTLADGRHLLVYNHTVRSKGKWRGRNMLNVAVSEDDGATWQAALILEQEEKSEFSYPAVIQASDGMVHITYTWKRQRAKHVVLDPWKLKLEPIVDGRWPGVE